MAKGQKNKSPAEAQPRRKASKVADEDEREEHAQDPPDEEALRVQVQENEDDEEDTEAPDDDAAAASEEGDPTASGDASPEGEGEMAAAQLGTDRYVLAAFFASGMLLAYIVGKAIHGLWATVSNRDWFSRTLPTLAGVMDEDKMTYGMIIGGIVALIVVLRAFRNPEIRTWSDEVASELAKVKWPTKKDVTSSTFVVITATTVVTLYLALLDRFWAFVTNIVYSDGS